MSKFRKKFTEAFDKNYSKVYENYEKWMLVPIIIFLLSVGVVGHTLATTGDIAELGIDFTGGSEIQFQAADGTSTQDITEALISDIEDVNVREITRGDNIWFVVETQQEIERESTIRNMLEDSGIQEVREIGINSMGAAVSGNFLFEAKLGTLIAFLVMSTAIFIAFRSFIPSFAVIFSAFAIIMFALAGMNILGIELSLASLAGLLMLIGYSVDTDIVLSTRVLKQKEGTLKERIRDSIATGVTMSMGGIIAFTILLTVSTSPVLDQIAAVMIMGLLADMPITWLGNASILKMYDEGRF